MDTIEKVYALTFRHRETGQILEGRMVEVDSRISWMSSNFCSSPCSPFSVERYIGLMDTQGFTLIRRYDLIAIWKKYREEQSRGTKR